MKEIVWNVRLDGERVCSVVAPGWYEARALACSKLNVEKGRIHVEQARAALP